MPELHTMTRAEKLELMEALWDDLSTGEPPLPSPAWHEQALADAQHAVDGGQASFIDWAQAKRQLRGG